MKSLLLITLVSLVCAGGNAHTQIKIQTPNQHILLCDLAKTEQELQQGLMFKPKLAANSGMLFIFSQPGNWSFWMKNTFIPLDIIWLDSNKKVIYMAENAKPCITAKCPLYTPNVNQGALYVLELSGKSAKGHGIQLGTHLQF